MRIVQPFSSNMERGIRTKANFERFDLEYPGIAQQPWAKLRKLVVGNVLEAKVSFN